MARKITRYHKPKRIEGQLWIPGQGLKQVAGWIIGKVLVGKQTYESPVYREVIRLDDGSTIEI